MAGAAYIVLAVTLGATHAPAAGGPPVRGPSLVTASVGGQVTGYEAASERYTLETPGPEPVALRWHRGDGVSSGERRATTGSAPQPAAVVGAVERRPARRWRRLGRCAPATPVARRDPEGHFRPG